ncbi:hypothetical protein SETIT_5G028300v2 [Setaria italica]|uniref:Uncharacterized protein n=2 Tax=Setaria TaxID=4554 RepID=A0A368R0V0_SETIT|nr:uncharacterized protein LOC117856798 isoform X2 [Setaria viridis]RCV23712.1 hypothetical protein SETIT_5G028300v2 [Setaria italica]RCV23713.1 hypothetical protein SETIT_5G028300v2 [Setaria italica]RCV23714.1 hypothetical protein SETIT_5G028300v2 [Setaria italica]RCV23715.1 hypothetical protein SETIT_5G028300v2 [Setaria italica]TKW12282.1 hypothetical protein SEVIR_5G027000v2 [Setaria viridis]
MEINEVRDQDLLVDLEKGNCLPPREDNNGMKINSMAGHAKTMLHGSWDDLVALKEDKSHHISGCSSHCRDSIVKSGESMTSEGEIKVGLLDKSAGDKEKKKWSKKPPRPPRPPTASPLDPADQKLISELSELAVLKRARIERMKALKKMKNSKPASSIGNLVALIITVIFCFFILWQDMNIFSYKLRTNPNIAIFWGGESI